MSHDAATQKGKEKPTRPAPRFSSISNFLLPDKNPGLPRRRSKSTGDIDEHGNPKQRPSELASSNSTSDNERNDVVSIPFAENIPFEENIPFGGKKNSSTRRKSGDTTVWGAFRGVIRKVMRFSDNIADMAIDIKEDTIDISKTVITEFSSAGQKKSLCKDCLKMRFEECLPGQGPASGREIYEYIRPLERVIVRRSWCLFCELIFQVLCREENDPLLHPYVQDHIQHPLLKGIPFSKWVEKATMINKFFNSEAVWPFGLSREVPDGAVEVEKLFHPTDKNDDSASNGGSPIASKSSQLLDDIPDPFLMGALAMAKVTMLGGTDMNDRDRRILEGVDGALTAAMIFSSNKRKRLPCWVLIKLHTRASTEAGLLAVHVAGHNQEPLSQLAEISRFHLRVATDVIDRSESTPTLRYGRILQEKIDLSLGKQWLSNCKRCHKCGPLEGEERSLIPNFRVIDLQKHRLHECTPEGVQYAALSYVWGDWIYPKLDNKTINNYTNEGALSPKRVTLPQAIIDAMEVARGVGLQYLWVDALCIKQDDENEKNTQIGQMDKIYANAVVTIVAADGGNANAPLKGISTERQIDQVVSKIKDGVNVLIPVPTGKSLAPWENRAWTLQEKLLSNRLIVFSGGHMIWHCRKVVHFEDMTAKDAVAILGSNLGYPLLNFEHRRRRLDPAPFSSSSQDGTVSVVRSKAFQQYATLVADYTARRMTYASDVLRALQGTLPTLNHVFGLIQERKREVFRYGLPQPVLDVALLWQPEGKCERRQHCEHCNQPCMPSWSWAGWLGKKDYGKTFSPRTDHEGALVKLVEKNGLERIRPLVRFYARGREGLSEWPASGSCRETKDCEPQSPSFSIPRKMVVTQQRGEAAEMGLLALLESDETGLIWRTDHSRPSWIQHGQIPEQWEASNPQSPFAQKVDMDEHPNIDKWHLVFRTQISQFQLHRHPQIQGIQDETGSKLDDEPESSRSALMELIPIWDVNSKEVGTVQVLEPEKIFGGMDYEFVVLSEAQYFGNELSLDIVDYPLYNVMLVTAKDANNVRTRLGLGKLFKHAWRLSNPVDEVVVLG